jgi:DNA (cytosine-5)-methyltransferase 1
MITFGSVCSGIEAASVAWHPLGWRAAWLAEIEPFPSAVLAHHYPDVPNLGDMKTLPDRIRSGEIAAPDVFCGGTPCQAFSVAGLRGSLDDARGNLSLTFCEIADAIDSVRTRPCVVLYENVPGVLSTRDNAFGCFLAGLAGEDNPVVAPGGKWTDAGCVYGPKRTVAWRVLDAQYFGLAQRRKRVFVVASAADGFHPGAVLFEFSGVRRDTAPSREAGQETAPTIAGCSNGGGSNGPGRDVDSVESLQVHPVVNALTSRADRGGTNSEGQRLICQPYPVANCLTARMHKGINTTLDEGQTPVVTFHPTQDPIPSTDGVSHCMGTGNGVGHATVAVAFAENQRAEVITSDTAGSLKGGGGKPGQGYQAAMVGMQVRRLTPVECERLQGFPDGYTAIPWRKKPASECPDGPRYKALGNSWAVPVVRWIGQRIDAALWTQAHRA